MNSIPNVARKGAAGMLLPVRNGVGKLRILLAAALLLAVILPASAQRVIVNVTAEKQTLADILPQISKQTGIEFSYALELVKTRSNAAGRLEGDVKDVLGRILSGTGIEYRMQGTNRIFLSRKSDPGAGSSSAPKKYRVTGTVRDGQGQPLVGVTVIVSGTDGTATGSDGSYSLLVAPDATLTFRYIGYESVTEAVNNRSQIDVVLKDQSTELEELVVVGYRTVKKLSLTGSVASVDIKRKENQPITNSTQMLYNTPGIWVNQGGSQPGRDNATISIRGVNSLNSTGGAPLVLLDGVEYDFSEIDPSTIESISVLKDVSAAIYGLKAANGVILVTSKKGTKGRPRIEYKGKYGVQRATYLPDVVTDPILYMRLRNLAETNSGISPGAVSYNNDQILEYMEGMKTDRSVYPASDWFDICLEDGYVQQHSVRLSGGTDAVTYSMGFGYTDQKGVFIDNDDAQRYAFDLKLNARVSDALNISGTFQGNLRTFNEVGYSTGTVLKTIMRGLPIFSDYHRNGVYGSTWLFTPGRNNIENPRMQVEQGFVYRNYQELLSTINADLRLAPHLKYYATVGFRKIDHYSKNFVPQMYTVNPKTGDTKKFNTSAPRVKDWDAVAAQYSVSHRLVWENDYDRHNIHVMVGQDWQHNDSRNFQAYNYGFNDNTLTEFEALTNQTNAQATGSSWKKRMISVYGRLAYTYDDRYMIEGTLRYDGSSNLSRDNRWHMFPSVMVAWNLSREKFFDVKQIDLLKIRASYGVMGSESVSPYSYQMTYDAIDQNYSFGGTPAAGFAVTQLTDRMLGSEKTRSYKVAEDYAAFNSRLTFDADYFHKETFDIIMTRTIPSHVGGLNGPKSNVGTVLNKGFELSGAWRDQIKNFSYGVNGSVSFVRNRVKSLDGGQILANSNTLITREGYPIRSFYVYEADGYYQSQEEIDNAAVVYGDRTKLRPGYLKYKNNCDDDVIDDKDKIVVGNSIPELTYSFGVHLGWKGLSLEAQFQGVGEVYTYPTANLAVPFNNGAGVTRDWATDSWTENNRNAKLPLLTTYTDAPENFIPSTKWLRNASYLRMKNIQLTYNFPKRLLKPLRIEALQVYVSGQNLWTISDFDLWDPEITTTRTDLYEYPNLKTVSIGLNLSF